MSKFRKIESDKFIQLIQKEKMDEGEKIDSLEINQVDVLFKESGLKRCTTQLSVVKKRHIGFDWYDSILDVYEGGYAISTNDDILFTYGIEPCCGVVLYDNNKSILFHLDGSTQPEEVKEVTDSFGFQSDAKVLIFPGVTCGIDGSFKYEDLEKIYSDIGCETVVSRIEGSYGHVIVSPDGIQVGSLLFPENEKFFPIQGNSDRKKMN